MLRLFSRLKSRRSQEKLVDVHVVKSAVLRHNAVFSYERIVNLRKTFTARHSFVIASIVGLAVLGYILSRASFSNAAVVTYYPSACLGTWQYADRAAGEPEGTIDDPSSVLEEYSAFHAGTEGSIYCGGFSPEDPSATGTLIEVSLSLVWRIGESASASAVPETVPEPQEASSSEPASSGEEGTISQEGGNAPATITSTTPLTTSTATTSMLLRLPLTSWFAVPRASAQESSPETTQSTTSQEVIPSSQQESAPESVPEPSSTVNVPAENPPPTEPATSPEKSPAGVSSTPPDDSSAVSGEATSPTIVSSSDPEVSTEVSGTPEEVGTEETPVTGDSGTNGGVGVLESPRVIQGPSEDFLEVAYSLDGTAWFELGRVNPSNWPSFTTHLPITTWDDVRRLQVRIGSLETSLLAIPHTYLDGIILSVQYEPPAVPQSEEVSVFHEEVDGENFNFENPLILEAPKEIPPHREELARERPVIDRGAAHRCAVTPFTGDIERGGRAVQFSLAVSPSRALAPFTISFGGLPNGVGAAASPDRGVGAQRVAVQFVAAPDAQTGSFSVAVVHQEVQPDNSILSNICQVNLLVR